VYSNPINKPEAFQDLSESLSKNKIQVNRSLTLNRRKIKTLTEKSIRAFHGRSMSQ
jgi:hypothetical protein